MSGFSLTSGICQSSAQLEVSAFWSFRPTFGVSRNSRWRAQKRRKRRAEAVHQPSTMLSAEGTSGFFPPDNTDMDMHKHGRREIEWKNSLKFMYCRSRDVYNGRISGAARHEIFFFLIQFTQKLIFGYLLFNTFQYLYIFRYFYL